MHEQYGQRLGVLIEDQAPTVDGNHKIVLQADGLVLQALFETIDPDFDPTARVGQEPAFSKIDDLLRAGAFDHRTTYEATLKRLTKMVLGIEKSVDDLDETSKREDFYKTLYDVRDAVHNRPANSDALTIRSLIDVAASSIVASARADNGLAYRVALRELSPFAIEGIDYATRYPGAANGALDLYDPATRQGDLTVDWLLDRAAFLTWSIRGGLQDKKILVEIGTPEQHFRDIASEVVLGTVQDPESPVEYPGNARYYVFGGEGADVVQGAGQPDRLYGMGGADWIEGKRGNDRLEGGRGLDVYQFNVSTIPIIGGNDGQDTIFDIDGRGVLRYRETSLLGGEKITFIVDAFKKRTDTLWQSADEKFTFTLLPQGEGGNDLRITVADTPDAAITLKGFRDGDFGIRFGTTQTPISTTRNIFGDREYLDVDPNTEGLQTEFDELGNVRTSDEIRADRDDLLFGDRPDTFDPQNPNPAGERFDSGSGHDVILADIRRMNSENTLGNADVVLAGAGRDWVEAGAGNDTVEAGTDGLKDGAWGGDVVYGDAGDDVIFGEYQRPLDEVIRDTGFGTPSGLKGDFLSGGAGKDQLIGAAPDDLLMGGGGADLLVGGAGDDTLYGDSSGLGDMAISLDWSATRSIVVTGEGTPLALKQYIVTFGNVESRDTSEGGDDTIYGGTGDDWMFGRTGSDFIDGGEGADVAFGEDGDDVLVGGKGNDVLTGDATDAAVATPGADIIDGGEGDDELFGNGGDDLLIGGSGDDYIAGDAGSDVLNGGAGTDTLRGGPGQDTYVFNRGDGEDFIFDIPDNAQSSEKSIVVVGQGFDRDLVKFRTGSLLIDFGLSDQDDPYSTQDKIHVMGFDYLDPMSTPVIAEIQFADGTKLSFEDILARGFDIDGTEANDDGTQGNPIALDGTGVVDRIRGFGGNDVDQRTSW